MTLANTLKRSIRHLLVLVLSAMTSVVFAAGAGKGPAGAAEAAFLEENDAAMTKMMDGMEVKPSGDVDHDFVAMMTAHHQGAIDMAQAQLRYGKSEQLRRIAQEIIVEQQQEIVAMRVALGQSLPPSAPSADQIGPRTSEPAQPSMHTDTNRNISNHEDQ